MRADLQRTRQQVHLARPEGLLLLSGIEGMVKTFENHDWAAATF
jgi:hypothetical protein